MVVRHLHVVRAAVPPNEADAPLVVDPDAVLPGPVAFSASSRLPGGAFKSSSRVAASSIRSFRRATLATSDGKPLGNLPAHTAAVRLSRKLSITECYV